MMGKKKIKILLAMMFVLLGSIFLVLHFTATQKWEHADETIQKASDAFKVDLNQFIAQAGTNIEKLRAEVGPVHFDSLPVAELNEYFSKLVSKDKYLKGALLFSHSNNYVFFRDHDSWVGTAGDNQTELLDWYRLNNKLEITNEWTDTYNFFMNNDNMRNLRNKLEQGEPIIWKAAQSEIPDNRDLLFCVFNLNPKAAPPVAAAFMYKTSELESRFGSVLKFKKPLVSIISTNNQTITPMRTKDSASIANYAVLAEEIDKLIYNWIENRNGEARTYSSESDNFKQFYWTRIESLQQEKMGVKGFAITVSEEDIKRTMDTIEDWLLYIAIGCFSIALFLFWLSSRKPKKSTSYKPDLKPLSKQEQQLLIEKGETEYVEFKSSLRWDYREEKPNKVLEDVILKSIAAFANAKGGTLFIGVNDDLEVVGLEPDFNSLKKKDVDYFELHLRKLINNQYGIKFSNTFLLVQFTLFNGKSVCAIQVAPSSDPLYLKTKNKQGQVIEKFYVRSGNASHSIDLLKEINEYIEQRFDRK